MTKITAFTIARSFTDPHIAITQTNALRNWREIGIDKTIVFGNREGVADRATELGFTHVPGIRTNEAGLPYVSDAFRQAWALADTEWLMFVNCDILFPPYLLDVLRKIDCENYLMVGQRWNTPINGAIDYNAPNWWETVERLAYARGALHPIGGMDYFVARKNFLPDMPDLFVGRWYFDNVIVGMALKAGIPVINATEVLPVIHQQHDYSHAGGSMAAVEHLPESQHNAQYLVDGATYNSGHATITLHKG